MQAIYNTTLLEANRCIGGRAGCCRRMPLPVMQGKCAFRAQLCAYEMRRLNTLPATVRPYRDAGRGKGIGTKIAPLMIKHCQCKSTGDNYADR